MNQTMKIDFFFFFFSQGKSSTIKEFNMYTAYSLVHKEEEKRRGGVNI